ncbi:hypothetical protein KP79_PYT05576 [Mizuhopecten yessoensis]|uniref:Uncharacterized protein n=1 Tax=Mizuhopecten yessoensis TaxID=6573 RepID=A0A210QJG8_MIZYE|nr:hypothetical protein KP79_PYT05576 [Mizuhopecten yessoensis]
MGAYRKPAAMDNNLRLGILLVSVMTTTAVSPTTLDLNATATGVNIGAKLCPVLDAGINITCLMDHGDETGRSYCEMDSSSLNCTSHTYSTAGYYTMWSHCLSEDIHLNDSATIYVGNKIVNMVAMADGQMFKPMPTTGSATVTVTYEEGTHVFLNITNAITGDPIYSGNSTGFSESRVFSPADFGGVLGQHAVEIALSNPLGKETRFVVFDIEEEILTPVMTTNVLPYMHVYDVATFKETMTFGSNIIGAIEFPDIAYVDRKFGQVREMCLNYTWTTTGTFTFDVLFSNMVDSETYPYVVVVQYPVNNITANGTNLIYVSQTLDVKFEMAADALFPMGNLNATIVYGDGTSKVLDISSLTQGASITDSPKSYAPGTYSVELSVFSESSHMNFSWTQYVEYPIQGLELVHVSEAPMSESVQNVSLRMTDPLVSPLLNITCVFDIDGTEYIKTTDLVYGVNFTIIHPFVGDGNKTITFNCSNKLSSQDGVSYMDLYTDCFLDGQLFSPLYKNKDTPVQIAFAKFNKRFLNIKKHKQNRMQCNGHAYFNKYRIISSVTLAFHAEMLKFQKYEIKAKFKPDAVEKER